MSRVPHPVVAGGSAGSTCGEDVGGDDPGEARELVPTGRVLVHLGGGVVGGVQPQVRGTGPAQDATDTSSGSRGTATATPSTSPRAAAIARSDPYPPAPCSSSTSGTPAARGRSPTPVTR